MYVSDYNNENIKKKEIFTFEPLIPMVTYNCTTNSLIIKFTANQGCQTIHFQNRTLMAWKRLIYFRDIWYICVYGHLAYYLHRYMYVHLVIW
jgi:hypothetical protein